VGDAALMPRRTAMDLRNADAVSKLALLLVITTSVQSRCFACPLLRRVRVPCAPAAACTSRHRRRGAAPAPRECAPPLRCSGEHRLLRYRLAARPLPRPWSRPLRRPGVCASAQARDERRASLEACLRQTGSPSGPAAYALALSWQLQVAQRKQSTCHTLQAENSACMRQLGPLKRW
jgi:hypothetical protein